jgi:uncharacterized protein (TIGR02145 family)
MVPFMQKLNMLTYLVVYASVCMFFAGPSLAQTSTEYSLSARVEGTTVVLELGLAHADLSTAFHEQPKFFYSEDAGTTWLPIPSNCLTARLGADQPTWVWNPLSCLDRKEWIGDKIRFKARLSSCVSSVTYQGYDYRVVSIGGQCWFAENLRSDRYRNGDPIPGNLSASQWSNTTSGAQAVYDNKPANLAAYGRLYNWYAVKDRRELCPAGWRVPSIADWRGLGSSLGEMDFESSSMNDTSIDSDAMNESNDSEFNEFMSGYRSLHGNYKYERKVGVWWSSTPFQSNAYLYAIDSIRNVTTRATDGYSRNGLSIRCVQVSQPVQGCTDPNFLEYNPLATISDYSCKRPAIVGCTDDRYMEFDPKSNVDDGSCVHLVGCGPGSKLVYHGESYSLVTIGERCWFSENLRSERYRNGQAIPGGLSDEQWVDVSNGAQAVYDNNPVSIRSNGRLYNWYAVSDSRSLCPVGWHVPDQRDWYELETALGVANDEADFWGWPRSDQGDFLKSTSPAWNGKGTSGFKGLPSGFRGIYGEFAELGIDGYWWSATTDGDHAVFYAVYNEDSSLEHSEEDPRFGFSIRCVRD